MKETREGEAQREETHRREAVGSLRAASHLLPPGLRTQRQRLNRARARARYIDRQDRLPVEFVALAPCSEATRRFFMGLHAALPRPPIEIIDLSDRLYDEFLSTRSPSTTIGSGTSEVATEVPGGNVSSRLWADADSEDSDGPDILPRLPPPPAARAAGPQTTAWKKKKNLHRGLRLHRVRHYGAVVVE